MPARPDLFESHIQWLIEPAPLDGVSIPSVRLSLETHFLTATGRWLPQQCWLDTGAPLTVIPHYVYAGYRFRVNEIPLDVKSAAKLKWLKVPCKLGWIQVRLPIVGKPESLTRPFSILTKLPRRDPPWSADPVPVIVGLQFLLACRAELALGPPPESIHAENLPWTQRWSGPAGVIRSPHEL